MIKAGGFINTQRHLVHEHSNATEQMPCVDTSLATNLINLLIGLATLGAVIVALFAIWENRKQVREDWVHSQQLAAEER